MILSYLLLKETIHKIEIINMTVSFLSSILIILTSHKEGKVKASNNDGRDSEYVFGIVCVLLTVCLQSGVYVILRALKDVHHSLVGSF